MGRKKLKRFRELETMPNVIDGRRVEPGWVDRYFGADRPILLELGCGKGEYTLEMARAHPELGVVGVDRNGARLWTGARRALQERITNALFMRSLAETLEQHFPAGRIDEIWIPFPDPLPKTRQKKHRLLAPPFLRRYRLLTRPGARVHLKTDDIELLNFAIKSVNGEGGHIRENLRMEGDPGAPACPTDLKWLETTYERRFRLQGRAIYYLQFSLD